MRGGWSRLVGAGALALVLMVAVGVTLWWRAGSRTASGPPPAPPAAAQAPAVRPPAPPVVARRPTMPDVPAAPPPPRPPPPPDAPAAPTAPPSADAPQLRSWAAVDLDAVRAALPNNLYWTMSAPTKDPEVLRAREEERARWNVEYGKVLSNTATDEEIDAYYAHRQRLSADYVAFAGYVMLRYRDELEEQDLALLKLATDMNLARLEEIPRQIVEAHERHKAHDAARRAWLEQQKAFEGDAGEAR